MVVGEKNHQKVSKVGYQKVLNEKDPFDQLILELGRSGTLDVCVVDVSNEHTPQKQQEYSRKKVPHRGKHSS